MKIQAAVAALLAVAAIAAAQLFAEPATKTTPCAACRGKRSLSLTPPNLGQFDGEIGVTPGKPFTSHRFDVKYKICPLCSGSGRHETYRLFAGAPPAEERDGMEACRACRWTGVMACRKCQGTGYQVCRKCRSVGAGKNGKPGWIVTKKASSAGSRASTKYAKMLVTPCGECSGVGKTICPDCMGMGGTVCRRCSGQGGTPKREKR